MEQIDIDELARWIVDCWELYEHRPKVYSNGKCYIIDYPYVYTFI